MSGKKKIIRITNIPVSLNVFFKDLLKELSKDYEIVALSSPGKDLEEVAEREGVKTIAVPIERRLSPFKDIVTLFRLIKVFRKEKPDMLHSMGHKAAIIGQFAAKLTGVKYRVHTFTGLAFPTATGFSRYVLKKVDKFICWCSTDILPEGKGVYNDLKNNKITSKPLRILGNGNIRGIDLSVYDRTPEVEAEAEKLRDRKTFTFVFVGRVVTDKGINELVDAFCRLNEEYPQTRLLLVGDRDNGINPITAKTSEKIASSRNIVEAGLQKDVRPWYAAADCFVLPSYREGFPNSVIEAGAMGLPSVVTDINGANEIIIAEKNGLIVPAKDAAALYSAMKRMIEDKSFYESAKACARELVASRYERGFVWKCLKDFYREKLG